jgi:20S proteasome subunit beta 1
MDPTDYLKPVQNGTVHVTVQCKDGVVMVSDSRSSAGVTVVNPVSNKIWQVAPRVFFGRTGTTAHTQAITRFAKYALQVLTMNAQTDNRKAVSVAAQFTSQMVQRNKNQLSGAFVIGGWDPDGGYQLYHISVSGLLLRRKIVLTGSGSGFIYSWCDANYREDFTLQEATDFAVRAVAHAMVRDGSCGGVINVVQITEESVKRLTVKPKSLPVNDSIVKT